MPERIVQLQGRLFLNFTLNAKTGLHIGGSPSNIAIGNLDNHVIRNPLTDQPYIPGSSLRGKMRSQLEKQLGVPQNQRIGQVFIHTCQTWRDYRSCKVCRTFGLPGEKEFAEASRLIVRDAFLTKESADQLKDVKTDLPFTEVKWEATIDRATAAAVPRQQERVPAGAIFAGELTFSLYKFEPRDQDRQELELFSTVLEALSLVQEDYLGGQGARGSGNVDFTNLTLRIRMNKAYNNLQDVREAATLNAMQEEWQKILADLVK